MSLETLESGRITHASQDGNREFISLLACIGADGTALPPALIYKGDSGILQDTWVEDVNPNDEAFFAVSAKGWSCDILGLNWPEQVFLRYTKQKARNRRRLLIVDGHSNHVNLKFIDKCDKVTYSSPDSTFALYASFTASGRFSIRAVSNVLYQWAE